MDEDEAFLSDEENVGEAINGSETGSSDDDGVESDIEVDCNLPGGELGGPSASRQDSEFNYDVLDSKEITKEMCVLIRDVQTVINLPPTTCRILLHHFKWNKEKLLETFYENPDQDQLFKNAHIVSPFRRQLSAATGSNAAASTSSAQPRITNVPKQRICEICLLNSDVQYMYGLGCGHRYCRDCWSSYLTMKVVEEGKGDTIFCPAHKCDIVVDDEMALDLIEAETVRARYRHLISNSFVECNRLLRWCPSPDCQHVIKVPYYDVKPVMCRCAKLFCFGCGQDWHEPATCRLLKLWLKKCSDDSETSNWISANTKECPKCHATIEKDGGCNHMTCKSQSCKHEFCWVCLGPWSPHGNSWYNCNRYDDTSSKSARDDLERHRANLQRYLHYYNRYQNHWNSLKLENKLYATVKAKMELMQAMQMSWIEVQFLRQAVDSLTKCRRTLMYTYAFAFYLLPGNHQKIFEDNQGDLEVATEQLSEFLERDLEKENLVTLKQKVQDKSRYVEMRRTKLLDHWREGEEAGTYWSYNC